MQTLASKLQEAMAQQGQEGMPPEEGMDTTGGTSVDSGTLDLGDEESIPSALDNRLNTLEPREMEFLAAHMTPNFAQAVGILLGSNEVYDYLNSKADANLVLVPVPKEVAAKLAAQLGGSEMPPTASSPEGATPVAQGSEMPIPQGPMADPMGM